METLAPVVTIAIPTYRRAALLERALLSATKQSFAGPMEILVLENPSEDLPAESSSDAEALCQELADPRIRYFRHETNLGMVGNWNRCLELSRSQWVVILHDDDWLSPQHIACCLAFARANPDLRLIGTEGHIVRNSDTPPARPLPAVIGAFRLSPFHFLLGNPFFAPGVMIDRQTALDLGGFDATWYPTMDHVFWLRFCEAAPSARIQHPLLHYYIGDNASLQPATLMGYIVNDWKQRKAFLARHYPKHRILDWYSRIKPYREQAFLQTLFNLNLPTGAMEIALGAAGWQPLPHGLRWLYLPIRAYLEILSILFSRRLAPIRTTSLDSV